MLFNSFNFWIIFPLVFILYWCIPYKYQNLKKLYLILISYLLYINWKPVYALILLGVTIITYYGALHFGKLHLIKNIGKKAYYNISFSIYLYSLLTLLPLLLFKYYNFINESVLAVLNNIGLRVQLPGLNWAIPIGISFYTFQAIGYLWDVYHGKFKAEKNFLDYTLFVSFFPQIASGPISKAEELLPQIKHLKPFNYSQGVTGLKYLLWGMFLKVVIADRLGLYVDIVYNNYEHFSGANCLLASVFYSIQIYSDFAGYSLMAIGIAHTLGFSLVNNFQRPFFATSITDFWKRWHISLTRWLTNYVYIPLGGSRCSKQRCYRNILLTFLVSGLWHGANWTFVFWGLLHGILQIIEKQLGWQKLNTTHHSVRILRIILTFFLVNIAWIFFRMPTFIDAVNIIKRIFYCFPGPILNNTNISNILFMLMGIIILFSKEFYEESFPQGIKFFKQKSIKFCIYVILFCMILSIGVLDAGQFIYVKF